MCLFRYMRYAHWNEVPRATIVGKQRPHRHLKHRSPVRLLHSVPCRTSRPADMAGAQQMPAAAFHLLHRFTRATPLLFAGGAGSAEVLPYLTTVATNSQTAGEAPRADTRFTIEAVPYHLFPFGSPEWRPFSCPKPQQRPVAPGLIHGVDGATWNVCRGVAAASRPYAMRHPRRTWRGERWSPS